MQKFLYLFLLFASLSFGQAEYSGSVFFGTSLPGSCFYTGQMFVRTDLTAGANLYICDNSNTFHVVSSGGGGLAAPGSNNVVLKFTTGSSTVAATSTDVAGLWASGACGTNFMKGDGTCAAGSGSGLAPPGTTNSIVKFTTGTSSVATVAADVVGLWAAGSCTGFLKNDGTCSTGTATVDFHGITDFTPTAVGGTSVTFNASNQGVTLNGTRYTLFGSTATAAISGASADTLYFYLDPTNGHTTLGVNTANTYTLTNFGNSSAVTATTAYPVGTYPIYHCIYNGTAITSCVDDRPNQSLQSYVNTASPFFGVKLTPSSNGNTLQNIFPVVPNSGTAYTVLGTDWGTIQNMTSTSAVAITLPTPTGSTGNFPNGWTFIVDNPPSSGANTVTVSPSASTVTSYGSTPVAGASSLNISDGQVYKFVSDGTNWKAYAYFGGSGGGGGSSLTSSTVTGSTTLSQNVNQIVWCDATSGAVTTTFPTTPSNNDILIYKRVDASANSCIINPNGKTFDTSGSNITFSPQESITFVYRSAGSSWSKN